MDNNVAVPNASTNVHSRHPSHYASSPHSPYSASATFTYKDTINIILPTFWVIGGTCMFCYYLVYPFTHMEFPKTIPLYWSGISIIPAYMTALNIFLFHREKVREFGISKISVFQFLKILRFFSFLGLMTILVFAITSAIQFIKCKKCVYDCHVENVLWFIFVKLWTIAMIVSWPRTSHVTNLIRKHNSLNSNSYVIADRITAIGTYDDRFPKEYNSRIANDGLSNIVGGYGEADVVTGKITNLKNDELNNNLN